MEEFILKQSIRHNTPVPEKILNAPVLDLGLEFFYVAFQHLLTCKSFNGVIPYTDIEAFATANDVVGEQRDDLHYHIRALDNWYSEWSEKKSKLDNKNLKNHGKDTGNGQS